MSGMHKMMIGIDLMSCNTRLMVMMIGCHHLMTCCSVMTGSPVMIQAVIAGAIM